MLHEPQHILHSIKGDVGKVVVAKGQEGEVELYLKIDSSFHRLILLDSKAIFFMHNALVCY